MQIELRDFSGLDWVTMLLGLLFFLFALTRYIYPKQVQVLFGGFLNKTYFLLPREGNQVTAMRIVLAVVYVASLSLLLCYGASLYGILDFEVYPYFLVTLAIAVFLMAKRLLSLVLGFVVSEYEVLRNMEYHRNTCRAIAGVVGLLLSVLAIYVFPGAVWAFWGATAGVILTLFYYNLIVILSHYKYFLTVGFYFIVYLCTLEIAPYLLLFKYFTVRQGL
jgi:hypothetical protein